MSGAFDPMDGITRMIVKTTASTGAGATDLQLRPPAGRMWIVHWGSAYQDDGAVVQTLLWTDPEQTITSICSMTAAAAFDTLFFYGYNASAKSAHLLLPLRMTYNRYLTFRFTASAAAKNSTAIMLVEEYKGINPSL